MNYYENCVLCPRRCKVDRREKVGYCGQTDKLFVARAALHMWEEPCISGENGSGTVFFSGCSVRCVYCQNREIALGHTGFEITENRLAKIFLELQEQGANNINLVTPTQYVPHIIKALDKTHDLKIPVLYNSSGYESTEILKMLEGYIDIYLPDFKYMENSMAKRYSNAENYTDVAKKAIAEMVRQTGECAFNDNGMIKKGVIVRHLVLPTYIENSKNVVEYLFKTYGDSIYLSIMNQYTPMECVKDYPEINRTVTNKEYDEIIDFVVDIGVENAFIQEGGTVSQSFIPDFNGAGVL